MYTCVYCVIMIMCDNSTICMLVNWIKRILWPLCRSCANKKTYSYYILDCSTILWGQEPLLCSNIIDDVRIIYKLISCNNFCHSCYLAFLKIQVFQTVCVNTIIHYTLHNVEHKCIVTSTIMKFSCLCSQFKFKPKQLINGWVIAN